VRKKSDASSEDGSRQGPCEREVGLLEGIDLPRGRPSDTLSDGVQRPYRKTAALAPPYGMIIEGPCG